MGYRPNASARAMRQGALGHIALLLSNDGYGVSANGFTHQRAHDGASPDDQAMGRQADHRGEPAAAPRVVSAQGKC